MGTNFGSWSRPFLGLVRFIGVLIRSGSYNCWIARWLLEQQWPMLTFELGLPRTLIARPSRISTWTEHHDVQPWHVVGCHLPSDDALSFGATAAFNDLSPAPIAIATPATTAPFMKSLRLKLFSCVSIACSFMISLPASQLLIIVPYARDFPWCWDNCPG